jgi:hypothetical protein
MRENQREEPTKQILSMLRRSVAVEVMPSICHYVNVVRDSARRTHFFGWDK